MKKTLLLVMCVLCTVGYWHSSQAQTTRPGASPPAGHQTTRPGTPPTAGRQTAASTVTTPGQTAILPVGSVVMPRLDVTLQRVLDWQKLGLPIPPQLRMGATMLAMQLGRFVPELRKYNGDTLIQKLPQVMKELGLSIDQPIGVSMWSEGKQVLMVLSISVQAKKLLSVLKPLAQMRHVQVLIQPIKGPVQQMIFQLPHGQKMPVALFTGSRLHFLVYTVGGQRPRYREFVPLLQRLYHTHKDPLQYTLSHLSQELRQAMQKQDADLFFHLHRLPLEQGPPPPPQFRTFARKVQELFRTFSVTLSLKHGLAFRSTAGWKGKRPWFMQILQPEKATHPWSRLVPAHVGWMGHIHVNHDVLPSLYQKLKKTSWIPAELLAKIEKKWNKSLADLKEKNGIDLLSLLRAWSGEWASGMLWDDRMVSSISRKQSPFRKHLKGVFAMVGFKQKAGAMWMLRMLQQAWNKSMLKRKRKGPKATLTPVKIGELVGFTVGAPGYQPAYLLVYKRMLLFAGNRATVEEFTQVWAGKKPSLQQTAQNQPELLTRLQQARRMFSVFPQVLWDLQAMLAPPRVQAHLTPLFNHLRGLFFWNHMTQQAFISTIAVELSPKEIRTAQQNQRRRQQIQQWKKTPTPHQKPFKADGPLVGFAAGVSIFPLYFTTPTITGILAAVAIPAFLKFIRKSKTTEAAFNLKFISDGAVSFFDAQQHVDKNGNVLPRQFPGRGMGWICAPATKPCATGKPQYPANPKQWEKAPWKQLRFSIAKPHYYQYCYQSTGVGRKATFTIRAHADLDCDKVLSTYEVRGSISSTGEVERTNMIVRNALE